MKKLLVVVVGLMLLTGCGAAASTKEVTAASADKTSTDTPPTAGASPTPTEASPTPSADPMTATFKVTTTGRASVSWGVGSDVTSARISKGQWSRTVTVDPTDTLEIASLSVTSVARSSQTVTCQILLNGVSRVEKTSKGKIAIADCSAETTK